MLKAVRSPLVVLPASLVKQGMSLRPEVPADDPFLIALYRTTREHELDQVSDWDDAQKAAFIQMQFNAQRQHYRHALENVAFDVIERDGVPIGRLYTQERQTQLHLVDIALIPEVRGQGYGGKILETLGYHAAKVGKGIGIFVEVFNPARHLYDRLGFVPIGEEQIYLEMDRPVEVALARGPVD